MNNNDLSNQNNSQGVLPNFYDQPNSDTQSYPPMNPPNYLNDPPLSAQPMVGGPQSPMVGGSQSAGQPMMGPPQTIVVYQNNQQSKCTLCGAKAGVYIKYKPGTFAFIWAAVLFLFCICCMWIPFVSNDCKDEYYYCQACHGVKFSNKKC